MSLGIWKGSKNATTPGLLLGPGQVEDVELPCDADKVDLGRKPGDDGEPCPNPAKWILWRTGCCENNRGKHLLFCTDHTKRLARLDVTLRCDDCGHPFTPGALIVDRIEAL